MSSPGMVYGTRGGVPLAPIFAPLEFMFAQTPLSALIGIPAVGKLVFEPPISVKQLAAAAVAGATGKLEPGVHEHSSMAKQTIEAA